ncbi:MAG: DUF3426 domain-containing protein [Alphaproteobacteria bacterium]|nr:DUF3426 domain-containing protein [Alphaproteobacteria bacterium]
MHERPSPMIRLLLLLVLAPIGTALAQAPAPAPPGLTAAQSQQALDVLKDPARRAQLIIVLEAIAKAAPIAAPPPAAAPVAAPSAPAADAAHDGPIQLAPDSIGAQLIVDVSRRLSQLSADLISTVRTVTDFPLLVSFVQQLFNDPWSRDQLYETAWRLILVLGAGLLAQWAAQRLLARPLEALARRAAEAAPDPALAGIAEAEAGQSEPLPAPPPVTWRMLRRFPSVVGRLALLLLPVLAFLAASYTLLGTGLGRQPIARLVILGFMNAYAICRAITAILRATTGPGAPSLFALSSASASYILRWTQRLAAVGVFGYLAQACDLLGCRISLPRRSELMSIETSDLQADAANPNVVILTATLRNRAAAIWHVFAIFYILALWAVWILDVPDGFTRLLRIVALTGVILAAARQAIIAGHTAVARWTAMPADVTGRYPDLDTRLATYHPFARALVHIGVWGIAVVAIMEAWSINAIGWFASGRPGAHLLSALGNIGATVLVAVIVWETVNAAIRRHLDQLARDAQIARSARLRTLLPMVRTTLFTTISLVAGLMVLSEIGVNIAPLLAGAGVLGIAIGFGSQKLVQDVITGLFLLLENTMQVGDAVTLGGLSGSVEALSVRTIRLRALDGSVHIIPFSAVTTVTNMTRDFGYAVIEVPIGLTEDQDRVSDMLRDIARGMRAEEKWRTAITDDLEIFGLDKFIAGAFLLQARMKTTAGQRWAVRRELNRRIKQHFDANAIDSPLTSYTALNTAPPTIIGVLDARS